MTKNKTKARHTPEQKRSEKIQELLKILGEGDADRALATAKALLAGRPVLMAVAVDRVTGKVSFVSQVDQERQEHDLELAAGALLKVHQEVTSVRVNAAKQNGAEKNE